MSKFQRRECLELSSADEKCTKGGISEIQMTITFFSELIIEKESNHWKYI
jgi:hypothetical protein